MVYTVRASDDVRLLAAHVCALSPARERGPRWGASALVHPLSCYCFIWLDCNSVHKTSGETI